MSIISSPGISYSFEAGGTSASHKEAWRHDHISKEFLAAPLHKNSHPLPCRYWNRTNHHHLTPFQKHPGLWFLVGVGCRCVDQVKFVNRRKISKLPEQLLEFQSGGGSPTTVGLLALQQPKLARGGGSPGEASLHCCRRISPSSSHFRDYAYACRALFSHRCVRINPSGLRIFSSAWFFLLLPPIHPRFLIPSDDDPRHLGTYYRSVFLFPPADCATKSS